MNYFAHAFAFIDRPDADPWFLAGTALPDWLTAADPEVRVRWRHVAPLAADADARTAALARGMLQHWADDARFHRTRAFAEATLGVGAMVRSRLGEEDGLRRGFLAHLLVELCLDAALIAEAPGRLERLYELLESVDGQRVQHLVNRAVPRPATRLAALVGAFSRQRVLWDYLEDAKLLVRINQVLRRVGLEELPGGFVRSVPGARHLVEKHRAGLLEGIPAVLSVGR